MTNLCQYDALNRLTNLVWNEGGAARASFAYQLKTGGNRTNLNESVNGTGRAYAWSYDAMDRPGSPISTITFTSHMTGTTTG